ncbi:LANO_0F02234g1_1 [Lachancea nothofagi CBS 11611]|uniref:LANO_0F02234g1_1 n=1 Tax=Lachancea nothofagi CBS 11611 TaxID=1266666 RepID=A0A1G4K6U4_9SACH|nr:LANO_0F02234g1_1 [Lachancea nothofagi CBS 11611]
MVKCCSNISPKNRALLNDLSRDLTVSLTTPALEFVDILIESLMYPRGNGNSLMNLICGTGAGVGEEDEPVSQDLGLGCLLESVHARHLLVKLKCQSEISASDERQLRLLGEIHGALVLLLKQLSEQIEVSSCPDFYRDMLQENVSHFRQAFHGFHILNEALLEILECAEQTGLSDLKLFKIDYKTTERLNAFKLDNVKWFEELMLSSRALREYLILQDYQVGSLDQMTSKTLPKVILAAVRSSDFGIYLQIRKSKLKICHRKVF